MQQQENIRWIEAQVSEHEAMLASVKQQVPQLAHIADLMVGCLQSGGKILFCGNGGSAADAQHWAAELTGRFFFNREPLAGLALTTNTSEITAIGNDYGYEHVFTRPLKALGKQGDVLIGISTSGNSKNVVLAFQKAREMGIHTVGFTGAKASEMHLVSDHHIQIEAPNTARIQEGHELCAHILFGLIEKQIFG
jgi:D-sedoheptulose 7-phosphate isomerase